MEFFIHLFVLVKERAQEPQASLYWTEQVLSIFIFIIRRKKCANVKKENPRGEVDCSVGSLYYNSLERKTNYHLQKN